MIAHQFVYYEQEAFAWKVSIFEIIVVRIFPHSDWIRRDILYLSVFSSNVGKYRPVYLQIWTLFTQWAWFTVFTVILSQGIKIAVKYFQLKVLHSQLTDGSSNHLIHGNCEIFIRDWETKLYFLFADFFISFEKQNIRI